MKTLEEMQKEYAQLLLGEGLRLQKGQMLVIDCPVEQAYFARICAELAYDMGCREVVMKWGDDFLTREKYLKADDEIFDSVHSWDADFYDKISEEGAAFLAIHGGDPENLKGVDTERLRRAQVASGKAMENFRKRETNNEFPWCVCAVPGEKWAKKVYPDLETKEAVEKLWYAILETAYVGEGDAIENWREHIQQLKSRTELLNGYHFKSLHYQNSVGTDLDIELPEGHIWLGGEEKAKSGVMFSANIPSEEVFTLPKKDGVNGRITASMPLVYQGNIIENIRFEFKDGKIVSATATAGEELLQGAISVDEGASYLGEVALVPYDSPISNSKTLFYSTLFDENAACHLAFGEAYPCIKGAENMSREELEKLGMNFSLTHIDFMIGTADLYITGITADGQTVVIFDKGNFVF